MGFIVILLVYRTWDCFVRCLDPSYLGPLLSHVIVALLPLISIQPKETAVIMHYLIVENRCVLFLLSLVLLKARFGFISLKVFG